MVGPFSASVDATYSSLGIVSTGMAHRRGKGSNVFHAAKRKGNDRGDRGFAVLDPAQFAACAARRARGGLSRLNAPIIDGQKLDLPDASFDPNRCPPRGK
jgi:hypothetical protein